MPVQSHLNSVLRFILLLLLTLPLQAENPLFSEDEWKKGSEGMDFSEPAIPEKQEGEDLTIPEFDLRNWSKAFRFVFFAVLFSSLLYILVRYIMSLQGAVVKQERIKIQVQSLAEAEENLLYADLNQLIFLLENEKRYREAIRAHFLLAIQMLHHKGLVKWTKAKTNLDLARQLNTWSGNIHFNRLTSYFEVIWYGDLKVVEADYVTIRNEFKELFQVINPESR